MCWRWGKAAAFNNCDYKRSEGGGRESTQYDQGVLDLDGRERFIDDEEVDSGRRAGVSAARGRGRSHPQVELAIARHG